MLEIAFYFNDTSKSKCLFDEYSMIRRKVKDDRVGFVPSSRSITVRWKRTTFPIAQRGHSFLFEQKRQTSVRVRPIFERRRYRKPNFSPFFPLLGKSVRIKVDAIIQRKPICEPDFSECTNYIRSNRPLIVHTRSFYIVSRARTFWEMFLTAYDMRYIEFVLERPLYSKG